MNRRLNRAVRDLRIFLTSALTTSSPEGSGLGIFLRSLLRKRHFSFRRLIGVNLAGLTFFAGIVVPQTQEMLATFEVVKETQKTVIVVETPGSIFQWPLKSFGISQGFSVYHPGMDLTDPTQTPIYPIAEGVVTWTKYLPFGYGNHALVTHNDGVQSLYAHMNRILVHEGQRVTKATPIGEVGLSGWTTGSHLHLEVYQNSTPTNPLEVLPEIKDLTPTAEAQQ